LLCTVSGFWTNSSSPVRFSVFIKPSLICFPTRSPERCSSR
jgi:hypothetical protein